MSMDIKIGNLLIYNMFIMTTIQTTLHSHCRGHKFETCTAHQIQKIEDGYKSRTYEKSKSFFYVPIVGFRRFSVMPYLQRSWMV
jgi:hypothetical protein